MDRDLVIRARQGDHDAFARLVTGSIGRLNAVARLIVRDLDLAEDAVQDAYVDAWRSLPGLRDPDRFDAWLTRLLVRACYDARRRTRRHTVEIPFLGRDEPGAADHAMSIAVTDQLARGLQRLTVEQRAVLVVAYYLDLPHAEAAAVLGIPSGTLKSRLHRAIAAMRASIDADERPLAPAAERLA
jgi:RNA polymerase sigma-70 factor (ECF subfamily)